MLVVGELIENSYSRLRYKVIEVRELANHWVEVVAVRIEYEYTRDPKKFSLWMKDSDEAPKAFRRINEQGLMLGPGRMKKDKDKDECKHCGRVGTQYFFKDESMGVSSIRCFICGAEQY